MQTLSVSPQVPLSDAQAVDTALNLAWIRAQFPSLAKTVNDYPAVFFDGPGGTQVPHQVIDAIADYLTHSNANEGGYFETSEQTEHLIESTHAAMADFLNCAPNEVVFGPNMTTLTFMMSRTLGREWQAGDEIILTRLDHDGNVSPWAALAEQGVVIKYVDIHPENCTLNLAELETLLCDRTRLVAVGYASNAVGTINNVAKVVELAHAAGALAYIDAVHYGPHGLIDVKALDCDFLACSPYKFFGPHSGVLYGKQEHLSRLQPYKCRPTPNDIPYRWEWGTQNHECLAGILAAVNYWAELGAQILGEPAPNRRAAIVAAMTESKRYENLLSARFISGLLAIPGTTLYGIGDLEQLDSRTPTFGFRIAGCDNEAVTKALGEQGIFSWHGNFYALNLTERLDLEDKGGFIRMGCVHYNTVAEIDRVLAALRVIADQSQGTAA